MEFRDSPLLGDNSNREDCMIGLQDLFEKVDLYFDLIYCDQPNFMFTCDCFKAFCENIHSRSGVVKIDSRVFNPPFTFKSHRFIIRKVGFYSHERASV